MNEPKVPRLWVAFVLGWLLVPIVSGGFLIISQPAALRLILELLAVGAIAGLYIWVTLRDSLGPNDLDPEGPTGVEIRRRLLLLGAMALLVTGVTGREPETESWWMAQNVVVAAGVALPVRLAIWVIGGITGLTLLGTWQLTGRPIPVTLILMVFGASGVAVRQLTISVSQLRAAREALARTAVDQERLRFARDLHDLLGHTLSLVVLKSELAGRLVSGAPQRAAVEIRDVERAAREALRQVRAAVAGYRQPGLAREVEAALEILGAAGIQGVVDDAAGPLPPALDRLFAWAVREGVTNVVRHSGAHSCAIRLSKSGDRVELTIVDNGTSRHEPARVGSGLAGLAERVGEHAGTMLAEPLPGGGFRLMITAPATGDGSRSEGSA